MQNVLLVVHLILALCLIGVVLLQRSEGGGLGIGGGGGGAISARGAATALGKMTWIFAIAFIGTSIALTIFAAKQGAGSSVVDRLGLNPPPVAEAPADTPATAPADLPPGDSLLPPPAASGDAPVAPPRAD